MVDVCVKPPGVVARRRSTGGVRRGPGRGHWCTIPPWLLVRDTRPSLPTQIPQAVAQIGKALAECGKAAESAGVEIWVEVHGPKESTAQPKVMRAIMDACGHKAVGVTWNSNDGEAVNGSIADGFELLKGHITSCHINDLGKDKKGVYPYRELFKKLAEIKYDRYTLCEVGTAVKPDDGEKWLADYHKQWKELVG